MEYIFITGVSTGLGYAMCRDLLKEGYFVIGSVRNIEDKNHLETKFQDSFNAIIMDVTDSKSIEYAYQEIVSILEGVGLYALINNAGIAVGGPLVLLPYKEFDLQMDVNLRGVFRVTQKFYDLLKPDNRKSNKAGRIINMSSISGLINTPFIGAYCVSKHALESMSDIYRRELDMYGIKVILIEPGPIKSEIWQKSSGSMDAYRDTDYWAYLKDIESSIEKTEKYALPTNELTKVIIKVLSSKKPKLRYIVHRRKRMIYFVYNFIPSRWIDSIVRKKLRKMK